MRYVLLLAAAAAVLAVSPAAGAKTPPKPKLSVVGWTTQPIGTVVQAKNRATLRNCLDMGNGQRSLRVVYKGTGIAKNSKVGIGVWGGSRTPFPEPTDAEVKKLAFKWPVPATKSFTQSYGLSFAKGPFGPENIDGVWNAKLLLNGKVVARGTVTVGCG